MVAINLLKIPFLVLLFLVISSVSLHIWIGTLFTKLIVFATIDAMKVYYCFATIYCTMLLTFFCQNQSFSNFAAKLALSQLSPKILRLLCKSQICQFKTKLFLNCYSFFINYVTLIHDFSSLSLSLSLTDIIFVGKSKKNLNLLFNIIKQTICV